MRFLLNLLASISPRMAETLEPPILEAWLKRYIIIERKSGEVVRFEDVFTEWNEEIDNIEMSYQIKVAPVDDFTPAQHFLASPDSFERQNALRALAILIDHPANASAIIDLLKREIALDQPIPDPPQELSSIGRLVLGGISLSIPYSYLWGVPTEGYYAQIAFLIHHIARTFIESQDLEEIKVFQRATDLLEEIMLSSEDVTLRIIAAKLLERLIYAPSVAMGGPKTLIGFFAPTPLNSQEALSKWGDAEVRVQHLFDIQVNPREPLHLRNIVLGILSCALTEKKGKLGFALLDSKESKAAIRTLHLFLNLLWEDPKSTEWDKEPITGSASPASKVLSGVLRYHRYLRPEDYTRLFELLRQILAYPIPPAPAPGYDDHLSTKSPRPGIVLMKYALANFLKLEWRQDEASTLLIDFIRSPSDLKILQANQDWARRQKFGPLWEQCIMMAKKKVSSFRKKVQD